MLKIYYNIVIPKDSSHTYAVLIPLLKQTTCNLNIELKVLKTQVANLVSVLSLDFF